MPKSEGFELALDAESVSKRGRIVIDRITHAGARAVAETTKALERKLEAATQAAVPGRLWRAWASRYYPNKQVDAAGSIYVKGSARSRGAITFWTKPGSIRGKRGQFLAIPLPAAGARGRARDLTPGEWERAHGTRLRFVYRPGRASLLVADDASLSGQRQVAKPNSAYKRGGRASATVAIFVLIPTVRFRNAVAVEPLVAASERELIANFIAAAR